jgi:hypothetical protein
MATQWLQDLLAWWAEVPADTMFFFSLPFIVAAAGLFSHARRSHEQP